MKILPTHLLLPALGICLMIACAPDSSEDPSAQSEPGLIEIVTTTMDFAAPDTIPSGWVTLRLINNSAMVHFAVLERMPAGKGLADQRAEVAPVFQNIMDQINGRELSAPETGMELPPWFGEIRFVGGPGLISPGKVAETTVQVEPGIYLLECYIKTNGIFHSYNPDPEVQPMVHEFTVIGQPSGKAAPTPTLELDISAGQGIQIPGEIPAGSHTIAVHFRDQQLYSNFVGHDVHLLHITDSTDVGALIGWMEWSQPAGLQTPAPAVFLGGSNEMPAGPPGYFNVELEPGEYAFIAEVPAADTLGMLRRFTVREPQ
ncbi:MAG: hypothetical protein R3330_07030 [Saprospiraceae bacterium]|nr:hypothetical protein [Saprospiraceae bacterium]